jgi:hypothetical protein
MRAPLSQTDPCKPPKADQDAYDESRRKEAFSEQGSQYEYSKNYADDYGV